MLDEPRLKKMPGSFRRRALINEVSETRQSRVSLAETYFLQSLAAFIAASAVFLVL